MHKKRENLGNECSFIVVGCPQKSPFAKRTTEHGKLKKDHFSCFAPKKATFLNTRNSFCPNFGRQ